eukprot:g129.t1
MLVLAVVDCRYDAYFRNILRRIFHAYHLPVRVLFEAERGIAIHIKNLISNRSVEVVKVGSGNFFQELSSASRNALNTIFTSKYDSTLHSDTSPQLRKLTRHSPSLLRAIFGRSIAPPMPPLHSQSVQARARGRNSPCLRERTARRRLERQEQQHQLHASDGGSHCIPIPRQFLLPRPTNFDLTISERGNGVAVTIGVSGWITLHSKNGYTTENHWKTSNDILEKVKKNSGGSDSPSPSEISSAISDLATLQPGSEQKKRFCDLYSLRWSTSALARLGMAIQSLEPFFGKSSKSLEWEFMTLDSPQAENLALPMKLLGLYGADSDKESDDGSWVMASYSRPATPLSPSSFASPELVEYWRANEQDNNENKNQNQNRCRDENTPPPLVRSVPASPVLISPPSPARAFGNSSRSSSNSQESPVETFRRLWGKATIASHRAADQLAAVIARREYGARPISLVGFSIGAAVICRAMTKLAAEVKDGRASVGLVENITLIGAPIEIEETKTWEAIKVMAGGRVLNIYNPDDWLLQSALPNVAVAGRRKVKVEGIEDLVTTVEPKDYPSLARAATAESIIDEATALAVAAICPEVAGKWAIRETIKESDGEAAPSSYVAENDNDDGHEIEAGENVENNVENNVQEQKDVEENNDSSDGMTSSGFLVESSENIERET